jgi:hypothetical protein
MKATGGGYSLYMKWCRDRSLIQGQHVVAYDRLLATWPTSGQHRRPLAGEAPRLMFPLL